MKYLQKEPFLVGGSTAAYREGYDQIKWDNADEPESAKVVMEHLGLTGPTR